MATFVIITLEGKISLRNIMKQAVVFLAVFLGSLLANDTLQVDIDNSQITWLGRKVTGEHTGILNISNGWVVMDNNTLVSGKFIFDMTSISNMDIESPEWKQKLEDHLKSEDFFYVDSFPRAILKIKGTQAVPGEKSASKKRALADLTIRGIAHEISFPFILNQDENHFIASGTVNVDRTLYNIQYQSGKFIENLGDKLIYDDFTVQFIVQTE